MASSHESFYNYYFVERGDKRVENWALMKDPYGPLTIVAIYMFLTYIALPLYMRNRKPYSLRKFIQVYNLMQIVSCLYLIYATITAGWIQGEIDFGCVIPDYTNRPLAVRQVAIVWWTMLLKISELVETVIFVLRKKYSQVTKLHVYHHASTFLLAWSVTKYIGGGMSTFPIILNSSVHVIMYTYYLCASISPAAAKKVSFIKSKITMIQMIQFCILLAHASQVFQKSCDFPNFAAFMYIPNVMMIFYMFGNFYVQKYLKNKKKT